MKKNKADKINDYIQQDPFAQLLGAKVEILRPGHSRVTLTIKDDRTDELVAKNQDRVYRKNEWFVPEASSAE